MKRITGILAAISVLLCSYSVLAQPLGGKCGDGICDDFEKAHPDICSADCKLEKEVFAVENDAAGVSLINEDSPFGFHPAIPYEIAKDMGVTWTRGAECPYIFWEIVDPQGKGVPSDFKWESEIIRPDGVKDFISFDKLFLAKRAGLEVLQNIDILALGAGNSNLKPGSWLPADENAYKVFVREAVKRYSFIKYWQIGNEPNLRVKSLDYAKFQQITYEAIKEANPDAKVLIAGLAGNMDTLSINDNSFESVLKELNGRYIDIYDIHFYGDAKGGKIKFNDPDKGEVRLLGYRDFRKVYDYYRGILDKNGFSNVPIWITEMGIPSGTAYFGPYSIIQTEAEQARDMLKRYIYPLALGVKKIFWAFGVMEGFGEWDNDFFDHTGLVYGGRDYAHKPGEKKLAYYTYKLMTEKLEGSDWSNVETVKEDDDNYIYVYKFVKNGKKIFLAWWDYFNDQAYPKVKERQLVLAGIDSAQIKVTEAVPKFSSGQEIGASDYQSAFNIKTVKVDSKGEIRVALGENPVYIEE